MFKPIILIFQVEDTKLISASPDNETELEVEILLAPKPQQDVRPIGFDIALGDPLVTEGIRESSTCPMYNIQ